ncbi:MAG: MmgE/PrpD family protein [Alphaproteobacteria bacterium]|nr:MmgE/PrpD family protein [Alphaproteobacteria bacterium]
MSGNADVSLSREITLLSEYVAGAIDRPLPERVTVKTRQHLLDSLCAIVSGARLKAGLLASRYVAEIGGVGEALAIGTGRLVPAAQAALANGMAGHADETDDSHLAGRFHPGCAIVPAALAVAERQDATGEALLRAVTVGYDVGVRANLSLGFSRPDTVRHSTHSIGTGFGAAAAAAALLRLRPQQVRHVVSYAAQQASGIPFWQRDPYHVEKAFDFGGMPARNGVSAALMVAAGFSAVEDPLAGRHSFFTAFGEAAQPARIVEALGERFEIENASIKKWCVGSPIQAVLDAVTALIAAHRLPVAAIARIAVTMPDDRIHIVDGRSMPDVCVQHLVALALLDGTVSFEAAHDHDRMTDPAVLDLRRRMTLVPSAELTVAKPARQAIVEIETTGGERLRHHAKAVRGTPENPMTQSEVDAKARDLVDPILGAERGAALVARIGALDAGMRVRELRPLLDVPPVVADGAGGRA